MNLPATDRPNEAAAGATPIPAGTGATASSTRTRPEPITLADIAREFRDDYLQWHSGGLGTLVDLTLRPGSVARAYLYERDGRYVPPLRYLLASVALMMAATWYVLQHLPARSHAPTREMHALGFIVNHGELLTLAILPLLAAIMRGMFHGLRVRYVDALVVLAYTQAQANLFGLLSLGVYALVDRPLWEVPTTIATMAYLVWSWAGFAQGATWRRWAAALATLVLAQVLNLVVVKLAIAFA